LFLHPKHRVFFKEDKKLKSLKYLFVVLAVVALALSAGSAFADPPPPWTLTDGNSSLEIQENTSMITWLVDGVDQLYEQSWWLRVNAGPGAVAGHLGDELDWATSGFLGSSILSITYTGLSPAYVGISATATYSLLGGASGSGLADISEQLRITNSQGKDLTVFQYCDFDLGGSIPDLGTVLLNANTMKQWDETWKVEEVVTSGAANGYEIGIYPTLLNKLDDADYVLAGGATSMGPGDLSWAWEWDAGTASSYIISKDKHLSAVPEPMSMMLGMLGLGSVAGFVRLRKK